MAAGGQEGGKEWRGGCAQGRRDVVKLLVIAALLCEMFALRVADADAQITLKRGYANTHTSKHTHTQLQPFADIASDADAVIQIPTGVNLVTPEKCPSAAQKVN